MCTQCGCPSAGPGKLVPWTAISKPDLRVVLQHLASTSLAQNLTWCLCMACPRPQAVLLVSDRTFLQILLVSRWENYHWCIRSRDTYDFNRLAVSCCPNLIVSYILSIEEAFLTLREIQQYCRMEHYVCQNVLSVSWQPFPFFFKAARIAKLFRGPGWTFEVDVSLGKTTADGQCAKFVLVEKYSTLLVTALVEGWISCLLFDRGGKTRCR